MKENCKRLARRTKLCSLVKPALLLTGMLMLVWMVCDAASGQYRWQWYRAWRYVGVWEDGVFYPGVLLQAIQTTLLLSALSMVFAIVWGGILAWMRLCASPVARAVSAALLGVLRNTPLLMQMFMVYFVVAPVLGASPFWAATFALAAFEGA